MRAAELRDDLLQVQAEVVARLVDRQVLGLRHATVELGASRPQTPPRNQMVKTPMIEESITGRYALRERRSCRS